ncbi:MAG: glycosyltransferase [Aigarchaeota archaeon]|nr:glycosyltransferase [Candidatus Pelearchaeum maunauluense]
MDRALRVCGVPYEVVIVDDSSPDGTADYAEGLSRIYPVRVVRRPGKLGLSSAVLDGVRASRGSVVAVMDADLQHPPEVLPAMLKKLMDYGCDVVIASHYVEGGSVGSWSFHRRLVSWGAILVAKVLLPKVRGLRTLSQSTAWY